VRVCFFNRSYYPDQAATGQLLTELAEDLVRLHGCEVSVVAGPALRPAGTEGGAARRGWFFEREWHNGVEIIRTRGTTLRPQRFVGRAMNYVSYFLSACLAGLRVRRPDVVVALTDPPIIGLAGLLAARRARARVVFLCQDIFPEVAALLEDFHSEAVNRALDRINRFLLRKADRVIALGDTMRARLVFGKGADPDKVAVIHNWADCAAIVPGPKRNTFSLEQGLADTFVVMHSGNVGLSQSLDTLVDAAAQLSPYPDLAVVVVGDGAKRPALEAAAGARNLTNIRFLPYQPKSRLHESFATADVFVVSLKAGLAGYIVPSKLYGILAAGRPYVAAVEEDSEVATITRKHRCGLLAEPSNPDDLAQKILALYHDRALATKLGANARQAGLEFDRHAQIQAYYELLRAVARPESSERRPALLKRPFDVLLAGLGLVASSPLWALIAAAIKLDDGGAVFYPQVRVGQGGRRFRSWKFRSMIEGSDAEVGPLQARDRDPRVTRVGRLLRATAMDELPQLWNIFKGDMSFVGPRALLPEEIEVNGQGRSVSIEEIPGYEARHLVRPGLTGLAQVYAARDIPRRHKFRLDAIYVRRQSFWLDLKLVALSFWISFRGTWERRGAKF
jgi:lipopolysaccharide/colanic/teichoic acid biosynthesis glycosyltransferase